MDFQRLSVFQEMWAQNVFLIELETSWEKKIQAAVQVSFYIKLTASI